MKKLDIMRAMQERGINKATICKRTGLATQNINSVIDGNPTVAKLTQIAEGIGCDITDLFFDPTPSLTEGEGAEENAPATGDLFSQSAVGTQGDGTTDGAQVGFFVFQGKRFKIVECE